MEGGLSLLFARSYTGAPDLAELFEEVIRKGVRAEIVGQCHLVVDEYHLLGREIAQPK